MSHGENQVVYAVRRGRNYVWTLNNPTPEELTFWEDLRDSGSSRQEAKVGFVTYQTEDGHDNGVRHLQGYVELNVPMRLSRLRRVFGGRVHFENRRGTQAQAIAYCQKDDTRVSNASHGSGGTAKKLGKDTLAQVASELQQGKKIEELSHDYPVSFISHGAKIRSYALEQEGTRNTPPEIIIYFGRTGTGKSAMAQRNWPAAYWVPWPQKGGWWWSMYSGQETVIFDEYRHQISLDMMLRACDRYPWTIQEKGSSMNFISRRIVITTNIHPLRWYPNTDYNVKEPLRRRLRDFATLYVFEDDSTWDTPHFTICDSSVIFSLDQSENQAQAQSGGNGFY